MEEKSNIQNQQDLNENGKGKKSKKTIILSVLIVLVLLASCVSFYFFSVSRNYFQTDNAKVTAKMYTITPNMSGKLVEWNLTEGDRVYKNQVLGRQEVLPYIISPIDGTIVQSNVIEGQMVSPATQLAVVADTDNLYIGVNIEETDIIKIQVGQPVDVKIDAYPGKTFKGVVSDIDRTTQTYFSSTSSFSTSGTYAKVTQLIPVKVVIENKENLPFTFGMNATVKIHIKEKASPEGVTDSNQNPTSKDSVTHYSSSIEAADQVVVTPNVSGRVSSLNVKIGQSVKCGDVLFVLDSTDQELRVKQAEASYQAALSAYNNSEAAYKGKANVIPAQSAYNDAVANYARLKTLYDTGGISKVELDNAKTKVDTTLAQLQAAQLSAKTSYDAAKAQMESAKAALDIVQKQLNDYLVKAPFSGEVASKNDLCRRYDLPADSSNDLDQYSKRKSAYQCNRDEYFKSKNRNQSRT